MSRVWRIVSISKDNNRSLELEGLVSPSRCLLMSKTRNVYSSIACKY